MHLDARRRPITSVPTLRTAACVSASGLMVITPQPSSRDVLWGRSRMHLDARRRPSTSVPTPRTDACVSASGLMVITPQPSRRPFLGEEPHAPRCTPPTKHFGAHAAHRRLRFTFGHIVITPQLSSDVLWGRSRKHYSACRQPSTLVPAQRSCACAQLSGVGPSKNPVHSPNRVKTFAQDVLNWENQHAPRLHAVDQSTSVLSCRVT